MLRYSPDQLSLVRIFIVLYFQASKKIFSSPIQKHVLFFTNKDAAYHAETYAIYSSVAAEFKGKALFINVPSTENKLAKSMHAFITYTYTC
jgi:hypothetical protein